MSDKNKSFLTHLECSKCGERYSADIVQQLCECGKPLLARYDLERAKKELKKDLLVERENTLWRYRELLPVLKDENVISLGEGMTPLVKCDKTSKEMKINKLYIKDEGIVPTGTFKARGAAVGVSKAKELGVETLAMPTNGNAGSAWSLYSARAGMNSVIIMPEDAPKITRTECALSGSKTYLIDGLISDAGKVVKNSIDKYKWFDASTLKEPYRIEGKKTMGYEICEQMNWEVPDVIVYPTGGGVGIIGIYKALNELREIGWIGSKMPKLIVAQAEGCKPIVDAWEKGLDESEFYENSKTIAFGINVPKGLGDFIVLEAVYKTEGAAVSVNDDEILEGMKIIAKNEGMFVCPEGACAMMAAKKLRESNFIKETDSVVILNTGAGIKYPNAIEVEIPYVEKDGIVSI